MENSKKRQHLGRRARCRLWWSRTCTFLFSHVGMFALVVGYSVAGAFAFRSLESHPNKESSHVAMLRTETVRRLWNVTTDLNVLFRTEWTKRVSAELVSFQRGVVKAIREGYDGHNTGQDWSFSSAFLFSITVISTIGYGNISPRTFWGKLCTIFYAILGIPLMFLYLTNVGNILARAFKFLYSRCCCRRQRGRVPLTACLGVLAAYICAGGALFSVWEGWDYLDGSYFCFITLSTVGLGDLVPGDGVVSDATQEKLAICSLYLLGGLGLLAMCFVLVQEEVVRKFRALGRRFGILPDSDID